MIPSPPSEHTASRGQIFSWTLFDFANTAFSVIIVTVIFNRYFVGHVAGGHQTLWGVAVSLSMLTTALIAPTLGAAADFSQSRKRYLLVFTLASVICTALLFTVTEGMVLAGMLLFIVANVGFEGGIVFYDAFLPGLTTRKSYGRVSGYGFAMGYAGSLTILLLAMWMLPPASDPGYFFGVRLSFVLAAAFYLIFSLPLFLFVPEPRVTGPPPASLVRAGFQRSLGTLRLLFAERKYPSLARFLIAFFVYNDGILTIIAFAALFAEQVLQMKEDEIILFFAVVQTSAIVGSALFGVLTDKIGPKRTISISLLIWIGLVIGAYFITTIGQFFVVALAAGAAMGSSQSASRSLMALLTPRGREAEFFGFYDGLCGKASAVVGPAVYGLLADFSNERTAALAMGVFFLAGLIILQGVTEPQAQPSPGPIDSCP